VPVSAALRLGTRGSRLARWQTSRVAAELQGRHPDLQCTEHRIVTEGDVNTATPLPEIGGRGAFTEALERALLDQTIDIAVHSLKDLPVASTPGIHTAAICFRADARDVLIAREAHTLASLPVGSRVGTCSTRRTAQLLMVRPDLIPVPLRGNVDTRIRRVSEGDYEAIVLAFAGVERLGLARTVSEFLTFLPAPGQGALAVQCRSDDADTLAVLATIDDKLVRLAVTAERSFLRGLGGGCTAPVAAFASISGELLHMEGLVARVDGTISVTVSGNAPVSDAELLGARLATEALEAGAARLM
jgi:hydroxymethylbilane synthase